MIISHWVVIQRFQTSSSLKSKKIAFNVLMLFRSNIFWALKGSHFFDQGCAATKKRCHYTIINAYYYKLYKTFKIKIV